MCSLMGELTCSGSRSVGASLRPKYRTNRTECRSPPSGPPVLYWLTGDRLVFAVGTDALYDALADNVVAFEVDHVDLATHEGWTVMVIGRAHPADDLASSGELWARPTLIGQPRLIGVSIDRLSGLRIGDD